MQIHAINSLHRVAQMIDQIKPECELGVDGGIGQATAPMAVAAGADVLVAGNVSIWQ